MKTFHAPHQSVSEFDGFYIEPPTEFCTHEIGDFADGRYHKAHVLKVNPSANHRAYPCFQPWKTEGPYGICQARIWVKYDVALRLGEWLSLASFGRMGGDGDWGCVTVNADALGDLNIYHTPTPGKGVYKILDGPRAPPRNQWFRLDFRLDFRPHQGSILVGLNGAPALYASVAGGNGLLANAHFGLYCSGSVGAGWVANSELSVIEERLTR